jgi:carboxypeptidase family protein
LLILPQSRKERVGDSLPRSRLSFQLLGSVERQDPDNKCLSVCSTLLISVCLQSSEQNVVLTGAISGRVTDASGAVVPGASPVLQNQNTGVQQSTATNRKGLYRFAALVPGTYSVTASLMGFRNVEALVRVQVGNTTLQDVKLEAGATGETIRVLGLR